MEGFAQIRDVLRERERERQSFEVGFHGVQRIMQSKAIGLSIPRVVLITNGKGEILCMDGVIIYRLDSEGEPIAKGRKSKTNSLWNERDNYLTVNRKGLEHSSYGIYEGER